MRLLLCTSILSLFLIFISCTPKKNADLIGEHMAGVDTRINRILVNKYAFEKAIVKIRGKVKNFELNDKDNKAIFELTDRKGNFIKVICDSDTDLQENDYIILSGEYDSNENSLILYDYEKFPI
ncbi:MAG TPA: hypothetical protein VLB82_05880 [Thermodesulfobacteriota bacterium]|nr:hypothetical protein [Thermodesulfobacteriota bacterium]